jgi:hypothetical protein
MASASTADELLVAAKSISLSRRKLFFFLKYIKMLFCQVKYFINQNTMQQTSGVKSPVKFTITKFKKFMKAYVSNEEKQLITIEQIEPFSEEKIERRFGSRYILID